MHRMMNSARVHRVALLRRRVERSGVALGRALGRWGVAFRVLHMRCCVWGIALGRRVGALGCCV